MGTSSIEYSVYFSIELSKQSPGLGENARDLALRQQLLK